MTDFETVIGLEVHVQARTASKLFCSCPTVFGSEPNSHLCPVCAGYPGVLPVLNKTAVESLVKTGLALQCAIREESIFARKQYFYPDLPKNYQISQYEKPLAEKGALTLANGKVIGITRIHLEEDAGKLLHSIGAKELDYSLVDLNRTGIPLMEIVSEPDLRSPEEAQDYLSALKTILEYLDVSDCDMEKGSMRCDANVSIRPRLSPTLGTKVEIKNMNTISGVRDAIRYEVSRQSEAIEAGQKITQETRLWDANQQITRSMRSKEQAHDYRYFPEPDLLPLKLSPEWIEAIRQSLPELPEARRKRLIKEFSLSDYDAGVLTADKNLADFYESAHANVSDRAGGAKLLSNWITTDLLGRLNQNNLTVADSPVTPRALAGLVNLLTDGTISGKIAKTVFEDMWQTKKDPVDIVKEKGLVQVSDTAQIEQWAEAAIAQHPKAAQEFKAGNERALGALIGIVMKLSGGQANPKLLNETLKKKILSS